MKARIPTTLAVLLAILWALPAWGGDDLSARLKGLEKGQYPRWLEVAALLVERGTPKELERARVLCEGCLHSAKDETSDKAALLLVEIHLAPKGPHHAPGAASRLLMRLARKSGEESILRRLEELRASILPKKRALLEKEATARERGLLKNAEDALREALTMPFTVPAEVGDS
ncbi:MAG: hypothetical protein ACYTFG_18740, partial [Planctomycetota bacterium]